MKRFILLVGALSSLGALAGCETMPEWANRATSSRQTTTPVAAEAAPAAPALPNAGASGLSNAQQQLLEIERRLSAAAQTQGLSAALSTVVDPYDGFVVRPGAVYQGAEVSTALAPTAGGAGPVFWQADRVFVSNDQTMGMTSGRYVQVVTGAEAIQGRYLVVWRREPGGEWKALSETRVQDPARPAPAATPARRRR